MTAYTKFADIYDSLIYEDIDYKKWSDKIIELCKNHDVAMQEYLDLGCGTGNMALNIAPFFKDCWCVDLSSEMLIEAECKFRETRLKPKFVCQDMRFLNLNRKFNLITCTLDCTNYLTGDGDLQKYFQSVANALCDEGLFIFDINSKYKLLNVIGENTFTYNSDEIVYIWENRIANNVIEMFLTFFVLNGKLYERFDEEHVERIYSEEEIDKALDLSGLKIISKLDNYKNDPVNSHTERITYVVSKL